MERWTAVRFAVLFSSCYVTWVIAFERWLEPFLRRCGGAIIGGSIIWVSAGGSFRRWGFGERGRSAKDAAAGLLGSLAVCGAAVLPVVAVAVAAGRHEGHAKIAASLYLTAPIMMTVFVVRVLFRPTGKGS